MVAAVTFEAGGESATLTAERFRRATGGLPFAVPDDDFFDDGDDCLPAPEVERIAEDLIHHCEELRPLRQADLAFLFKRKGGKPKGKLRFGLCAKPSGLLAHFARFDFVIWLAADHGRDARLTGRQAEALVYHELRHAGREVDEESGEIRWVLLGHDWEGFGGEVERYGLWQPDLQRVGDAFRQAGLFDGGAA